MARPIRNDTFLKERLDFIGMDQRARAVLSKVQPLIMQSIGPALTAFYDKVSATPDMRKFFRDDQHMAGAKTVQETHWGMIAAANYNEDYVGAVRKIGQMHARIGLEPRWYIGGYALIIEQLVHAVVKEQWPHLLQMAKVRPEEMAEALSCLIKAAMLDMDFAISIYLETLDEQRRHAEEAQEAAKQEAVMAVDAIGIGLAKLAAKDLTYRMPADIPSAYRGLQTDFNAAIEQLEAAMQSVAGSAGAIQSGTREISVASDDLSRRTEQQAANLEETAAALDEITATVKKSAQATGHLRQVVAAANEDAQKSSAVVDEAVEAMDAIATSARQISQIIGVIDEIAFQTNLLALNAGVEAARAGDAGRGFAVVASEVRALAQRTAEAAKEIKSLISASATQVDHGVRLVSETGRALQRIMTQVAEINGVADDIASGAREQATGLNEVNVAINQMDQVTQQNAAMVEQSTAASHSLSEETTQLSSLVGQFKLGRAREQIKDEEMRAEPRKVASRGFR